MKLLEVFREKFSGPQPMKGGVFGLFNTPEEIMEAAEAAKNSKYTRYDCLTPFPLHGLDDAMGVKRSKLPWVTLVCGLAGGTLGFALQTWNHISLWPLNIAGKPLFSWPAYVPITFELTILFAAHLTVAAFWILNRFPNTKPKILHPDITSDKFALWIPDNSNHYNEEEVVHFIKELGASKVEVVKE